MASQRRPSVAPAASEQVKRVNAALKARGLLTWFDDEKMRGQILDQMASGVNRSATVAVFITKRYLEKVNGD